MADCIQKATVGVSISKDAVESCVERNTPSHPTADVMRTDLDELKWLLTLIVGIAALFSILQAAAAWFSASSYREQANEKLKQMDEIEKGLRERYPILEEVEKKREEAHSYLNFALEQASRADFPEAEPTDLGDHLKTGHL
jgi:hypothetical protein